MNLTAPPIERGFSPMALRMAMHRRHLSRSVSFNANAYLGDARKPKEMIYGMRPVALPGSDQIAALDPQFYIDALSMAHGR